MVTKFELVQLSQRKRTELVGIQFELCARQNFILGEHYAKGLHAWFLNHIRDHDPALSAYLHDGQSQKPFSMSRLEGGSLGENLQLVAGDRYQWSLHCFSQDVVAGVLAWLRDVQPSVMRLGDCELTIERVKVGLQPYTYQGLWRKKLQDSVTLSFLSPTGFRRRGGHLPLPMPRNVFQSYLRRWNDFSGFGTDTEDFLDWVDEFVVIRQHRIETQRVAAGKQGVMTGFVGSVQFAVRSQGKARDEYVRFFSALGWFAPYCGTGHKTTFGLGYTVLGEAELPTRMALEKTLLLERIEILKDIFSAQRQRYRGDRTERITELWAVLLARRERGESLQKIALDLDLRYETAKTYVKLARRSLKSLERE